MTSKAVLFDLDGTVLDTPAIILSAFEDTLLKHGEEFDRNAVRQTIGKPLFASFALLMPDASEPKITDCVADFRMRFRQEAERRKDDLVFPEWRDLASELKNDGVKIAAVTSKVQASALEVLQQTGIAPFFDGIFCHDMVRNGKPASDMANLALERLTISQENAIVVGDSIDDIAMAKGAGIASIPVSWGVNSHEEFSARGVHDAALSWTDLKTRLYHRVAPQH